MSLTRRRLLQTATAAAAALSLAAQQRPGAPEQSAALSVFPDGFTPEFIGAAVAHRFLEAQHIADTGTMYSEVCAWVGALQFARRTSNKELLAKLRARFDSAFSVASTPTYPPMGEHVDMSVFGALPLELYLATGETYLRDLGLRYADAQWSKPDAAGLSHETRFWIDDMYMIIMLQVQAFRATKQQHYLDRAALEMATYLDKLQQPNGLFFHAPDAPFFWGRGNGWFAAGMAELLTDLTPTHRLHSRIAQGYRNMMQGLASMQSADGTWRELIDRPNAWAESSGSAMFTFALIQGVRKGWLPPGRYSEPTHRAWTAIAGYVDQNGDVTDVCQGTEKRNSAEWYLTRKRRTGDLRGQAPVLWSATALLA